MLASSPPPAFLFLLLYALHSFVGLTYEVVWIKYLTSTLGMTLPAFAIVLSTFMAGLGLGSYILSRVTTHRTPFYLTHIQSSLLLFAVLQAAIGILGMAFPFILNLLDSLYVAMAPETEGFRHLLIRCTVAGMILLPITSLLGTGFPLLAGLSTSLSTKDSSQRPGLVYYVGVLASAIGALASLAMIPAWGLLSTSLVLGALNLAIAMLTWASAKRYSWTACSSTSLSSNLKREKGLSQLGPSHDSAAHDLKPLILAIGALVGFFILGLEIVGAQYIWLVINATAYSEGLLFAAILLAMAMGSALYLVARSYCSPSTLIIVGFLTAACAQIALIPFAESIASVFDLFLHQSGWVQDWIGTSSLRFFIASGALTFSVLGLPALGYGLVFCSLCELATNTIPHSLRAELSVNNPIIHTRVSPLAQLYAWHNWGSVAGVLLTSFVLIPWLGLTISLTILSVCGLVLIWIVLAFTPLLSATRGQAYKHTSKFQTQLIPISVILLGLTLWIGVNGDLTFQTHASGESHDVIYQREDASGVVEVFADRQTGERTLFTSRLRQEGGSRQEDIRVQRLQGYLPILLHPNPKRTLVVGLGTGIAAGSYLRKEVEEVTIVEISEGIIEAAELFEQESGEILSHPKTRIVKQDGRNFMKLSRHHYDLIIQELFFPYQSGVGSLYTVEHYQRIRNRLAPGGMVGQWITINQLGLNDLRMLVHTFHTIFPHTSLWLHGGYLLILGGLEPLSIDYPTYTRRFYEDDHLGGLSKLGTDPYDMLGGFVTQGAPLQDWASGVSLNTDDNRRIEYSAPLSFAKLNTTTLAAETLESFQSILLPLTDVVQMQKSSPELDESKLTHISKAFSLLLHGIVARTREQHEQAESLYVQAWQHNPNNYQIKAYLEPLWASRGRALLLKGEQEEASRWLRKASDVNKANANVLFDLGLLASQEGNDREAITHYTTILEEFPRWPQRLTLMFNLGLSHYRMEDFSRAAQLFQKVIRSEPSSVNAHFNLANSLAQTEQYEQAAIHYRTVLRLAPSHQQAQENYLEIIEWITTQESDAPPL